MNRLQKQAVAALGRFHLPERYREYPVLSLMEGLLGDDDERYRVRTCLGAFEEADWDFLVNLMYSSRNRQILSAALELVWEREGEDPFSEDRQELSVELANLVLLACDELADAEWDLKERFPADEG